MLKVAGMPHFKKSPSPRTRVPELDPLVRCWSLSMTHHAWSPGASDDQIIRVERSLKRRLPKALRAIYEMSNGLGLVGCNVVFVPLEPSHEEDLALVNLTSKLVDWGASLPDELLIFGDDGSDSLFGLWLPEEPALLEDRPVIELGETEQLAIAGTSLCRFLKARCAYYLCSEEAAPKSLDALGLPEELRTNDPDDDDFARITLWADPEIPDPSPDPYSRGVTAEELRSRFSNSP